MVKGGYYPRRKYKTVKALKSAIESYFNKCDAGIKTVLVGKGKDAKLTKIPSPKPYTWSGLARALGFSGRNTLIKYVDNGDEYADAIIDAKLRLMDQWESSLMTNRSTGGVIYNLTNSSDAENRYTSPNNINIGGQQGNPLKVENTTDSMSEADLKAIEAILVKNNEGT